MRLASRKTGRRARSVIDPEMPVCGIEAEFDLLCDGVRVLPEDFFGGILKVLPDARIPWRGKPVTLPNGCIAYFDRGVIEVATPPIVLAAGAPAISVALLNAGIRWVRNGLDRWQRQNNRVLRLRGFSAHYNFSFVRSRRNSARTLDQLAFTLCHILPFPGILVATNARSRSVGVRPRINRLEVTIDYTVEPVRMAAMAALVFGVLGEAMSWRTYRLAEAERRQLPLLSNFRPRPHTSRNGWLAHIDCFTSNPFNPDTRHIGWQTKAHGVLTIRQISTRIVQHFRGAIKRYSSPSVLRCINEIIERNDGDQAGARGSGHYHDVRGGRSSINQHTKGIETYYARVFCRVTRAERFFHGDRQFVPIRIVDWFAIAVLDQRTRKIETWSLDDIARCYSRLRRPT